MGLEGTEAKNDCADKCQQQFNRPTDEQRINPWGVSGCRESESE
jgi:hypothetical protein